SSITILLYFDGRMNEISLNLAGYIAPFDDCLFFFKLQFSCRGNQHLLLASLIMMLSNITKFLHLEITIQELETLSNRAINIVFFQCCYMSLQESIGQYHVLAMLLVTTRESKRELKSIKIYNELDTIYRPSRLFRFGRQQSSSSKLLRKTAIGDDEEAVLDFI
ncbi:hypothetical protein ACJX0J_016979, partial [Zea mays]